MTTVNIKSRGQPGDGPDGPIRAFANEPDAPVPILYEDAALVVVMKPSGLAVHRGWAHAPHYALDRVRDQIGQYVWPVHRLDQATSGVLVMALTQDAASHLSRQFAGSPASGAEAAPRRAFANEFSDHTLDKRYLALVRGIPPEALTLDHGIALEPGEKPQRAVTHFRRLWIFERRYSLVEARPETGRRHQIRRHLKHLSCPIIGDVNYGKGEHNRLFRTRFALCRLALHALSLTFVHPVTGLPLTVTAPLPADLAGPLAEMGCPLEALGLASAPPSI